MPKAAKSSKVQRFYVYRTVEKDGVLKSKNIGTAYVTRVLGDTIQLYSLFGRTGNKKRGDYAVLTPGGRSAFSITGMYGLEKEGNYPRVRVEYDYLHWISPIGVTGHVLGALDVDFMGKSKTDWVKDGDFSYINVYEGNAYISDPNPLRVGVGVGYGVAYNFMGRFSIMPYVRVAGTYNTFLSLSNKEKDLIGYANGVKDGPYLPISDSYGYVNLSEDNKADFFGVRGDVGFKFQVNFTNKLSMFVGAEYNYFHGFGKKSTADITAADYFYNKEYLGHGKSAINFQLGFRFISF